MSFGTSTITIVHQEPSGTFGKIIEDYLDLSEAVQGNEQELAVRAASYFKRLAGGTQRAMVMWQKSDAVNGTGTVAFASATHNSAFKVNTITFTGKTGSVGAVGTNQFQVTVGDNAATAQAAAAIVNASLSSSASAECFAVYTPAASEFTLYALYPGPRSSALSLSGSGDAKITVNGVSGTSNFSSGTYGTVGRLKYQYEGVDPTSTS